MNAVVIGCALVMLNAGTALAGTMIQVPSDPRASYEVIEKRVMKNGHLEVITRRVGPSGTSFARREINCAAGTVRYLGEGDTLAEAKQSSPEMAMGVPVPQSITGVITRQICAKR